MANPVIQDILGCFTFFARSSLALHRLFALFSIPQSLHKRVQRIRFQLALEEQNQAEVGGTHETHTWSAQHIIFLHTQQKNYLYYHVQRVTNTNTHTHVKKNTGQSLQSPGLESHDEKTVHGRSLEKITSKQASKQAEQSRAEQIISAQFSSTHFKAKQNSSRPRVR